MRCKVSEQNRPNLHAVGLLVDIQASIQNRIRGKAGKAKPSEIFLLLNSSILRFIEEVDSLLDEVYGA